jgi:hypothetical protein
VQKSRFFIETAKIFCQFFQRERILAVLIVVFLKKTSIIHRCLKNMPPPQYLRPFLGLDTGGVLF